MAALTDTSELFKRLREFAVLNSAVRLSIVAVLCPPSARLTYENIKNRLQGPKMLEAMGIRAGQKEISELDYHLRVLTQNEYVSVEPYVEEELFIETPVHYKLGRKGIELYEKMPKNDRSKLITSLVMGLEEYQEMKSKNPHMVTVLKIIGLYHGRGGITFADTLKERVLEGVDERDVQAYFGSLDVDGLIERRRTEHGRRYFLTEMGLEEYRNLPKQ